MLRLDRYPRFRSPATLFFCSALLTGAMPAKAQPPEGEWTVKVERLTAAPTIDGELGEWTDTGWLAIPVAPAKDDDNENRTGNLTVQLRAGVADDHLYIAARWPDDSEDTTYRPWEWSTTRYKRTKIRDDMFAVRFHLDGDYNRCMIAETTYRVDVWLWSAGRTNVTGYAEDMWQLITVDLLESAAEYKGPTGKTVYIRKRTDEGTGLYSTSKIKTKVNQGPRLPGVTIEESPSGSSADVRAKGVWRDGFWQLELSRPLETGHADDVRFSADAILSGAIAVFNKGFAEHKSVSGTLLWDFSVLRP